MMRIGLVGPCTSGKSTIRHLLENEGYEVRHIAQEHSYVPRMWKKISNPDILIYLDVSYEFAQKRRKMDWDIQDYNVQIRRLAHARANADFYINTNDKSIDEIVARILAYLASVNLND